jgi:Secretion system C-terminal sorting domain
MKQLLFINLLCIYAIQMNAQTECYIKYTYDDSGNRIKREFICAARDTLPPYNPIGLRKPKPMQSDIFEASVYPNPSTGFYTVALNQISQEAYLQIINYAGQQVLAKKILSLKTEIDITNLANGMYTFVIKTSLGAVNKRVVKIGND